MIPLVFHVRHKLGKDNLCWPVMYYASDVTFSAMFVDRLNNLRKEAKIGVQQILMKPQHYPVEKTMIVKMFQILENRKKSFFFKLFWFIISSMQNNLLFVESQSEKTDQNFEVVIGAVGAGVLLLVIVVILSYILR